MSDTSLRHTIALLITIVCLLAWLSGYFSGMFGWWWTVIGIIVVYAGVYKAVNKD